MKIAKPSSYSSFAPSNDGNTCAVKSWCAGALALLAGLVLFNVHWWNDVRREISQDENMESRQVSALSVDHEHQMRIVCSRRMRILRCRILCLFHASFSREIPR